MTHGDDLSANIMDTGMNTVDPLTMGFSDRTHTDFQSALHGHSRERVKWSETLSDGVYTVTATEQTSGPPSLREWTINPAKGFQVESFRSIKGGETTAETISVLELDASGRWFPSEVHYFNSRYENGETPQTIIEVSQRRLNDDALALPTPTDIGVHPGTNVYRFIDGELLRNSETGKPQLMGYIPQAEWHGDGWPPSDGTAVGHSPAVLVAWRRLARYERDGKVRINSGIRDKWSRAMEEGQARRLLFGPRAPQLGLVNVPYDPKLWEKYVERFIARYKLSDAQAEKAWGMHKQCLERADRHLNRHRKQ